MTYILELENEEDFPKVKKLLEQIKGAKLFDTDDDNEAYPDGTPKEFIRKLAEYANSAKEQDWISEEEFSNFVPEERCRLNSAK